MDAIRIIAATRVNGRHLDPGTVHAVPGDVDARSAQTLVDLGRAEPCDAPKRAKASKRTRSES